MKCVQCGEETIEYYCTWCSAEQVGKPYFKCVCCGQKILEGHEAYDDNRKCVWCGQEEDDADEANEV